MATVPALSSPFQQRDVAEWSRLDRLTGVLERARRETDHWKASRGGHTGNYNKVVDCRARNAADGSLQQRHKKQLEVFQAQGPGGSLQVIRTQSVTSTSSGKASPWLSPAFDNLQLTLNPLDLSSQKTKASVGRSGSIGGRRPPSRPRSLVDRAIDEETGARLSEVSRLCQQIHEDSGSFRRSVSERRSYRSSGSTGSFNGHEAVGRKKSSSTEDLPEEVDEWRRSSKVRRSLQLSPRSSVAAEDLPPKGSVQKLKQELEGRRRLDIKSLRGHEAFENVLKRGEDIINSEALGFRVVGEKHEDAAPKKNKRNSFVTVESLKEVRERLRRTGSPVEDPSKDSEETDDGIVTEDFTKADNDEKMEDVPASRVKSYVYGMETQTKSGREVRKPPQGTGSLESRTSNRSSSSGGSRTEEWYNRRKSYGFEQVHGGQAPEQPSLAKLREKNRVESSTDSGICRSTEAVGLLPWHRASPTKLKSDDAAANNWREPHKVSRINNLNSVLVHDEKSFEGRRTVVTLGVETANKDNALFISEPLLEKPSSEGTVGMKKSAEGSKGVQILIDNLMARENRRLSNPVTITIPITSEDTSKEKGIVDNKRQYFQQLSGSAVARNWKRTPVTLNGHDGSLSTKQWKDGEALQPTECELKRHSIAVDESKYVRGTYTDYNTENGYSSGIEQSGVKSSLTSTSSPDFAKRHGNLSFASSWSRDPIGPGIHVSFTNNTAENKTTAEEEDDSDQMLMGKKTKRVEFCKTEVHFAAEPGRFNIVETNEKPPPTNMFRRRRRSNPVPEQPKSGLPEVRFGDSPYEKSLLASADVTETVSAPDAPRNSNSRRETFEETGEKEDSVFTESNATIFPPEELGFSDQTNENQDNLMSADSQPKGILKNNRKPRPFHLGEETDLLTNEESSSKWSTPLRSVQVKEEESRVPWRSNVMLRQSADNVETRETELQKLLKSLRPASQRRSFEDSQERKSASEVKISVADRVRQVESKGYSTKVNFGVGEATVVEHPPEDGDRSKPSWLYKEEPEGQDSREDKGLVIRIGKDSRERQTNRGRSGIKPNLPKTRAEECPRKTSTTITIDLTPSPVSEEKPGALFGSSKVRTKLKCAADSGKPEVLQSPSLIMKTIGKPFTQVQKLSKQFEEKSTKSSRSVSLRTMSDEGESVAAEEGPMAVPSQLAALRELYGQSDDSEQADEEVRSILSGGGDEQPDKDEDDEASVLSGSWSRVRGIRNVRHHFRTFSGACAGQDAAPNVHRQHQVSVATAVLPSYADSDRLRSVETLVSTRSGRPKITSISLRYDSDHPTPQSDRRRSARPELSPPRGEAAQKPACRSQDAFMQTDFLAENQSSQQKNEKFHSSSSVFRENVYMGHPKTIKLSSVKKFPSPQPPKSYLTTEEKRSSLLRDEKNFQHVFHPSRKELSSPSNRKYENVPLPSSKVNKYDDSDHDYEEIMPLPISQTPVSVPNNAETRSSVLSTACDRKVAVTKTTASCHRISPSKEAPDVVKPSRSSSATRGSTTPVHHSGHERKRSPSPRSSSVQRGEERKAYWAREERAARHRSTSRGRQEAPRTAEQRLEDDMLASESRVHQSAEACRRISAGKDADSAILEELTRAADQILQAVNGYTDEESRRASSDEDGDARHRKGRKADQVRRPAATLGTISEGQATRRRAEARPRPGPTRVRTSRLGPTSSTSSVESFTKETRKTSMVQARLLSKKEKSGSLERPGRTARLLQRATSREQLLSHGSSSEDIAPGDVARRPRAPRRSRPTPSSAGDKKESLTQTSAKARREPTETSRTRDKSSTAARSTAAATKRSADANISSRAVSSRDHGARLREEVPRRSRTSTHAGVLSTRRGTERPARGAERSCGVAEKKKTASESPGSSRQQSRALKY
ncbi:uncharacterized protein LOC134530123 isoform X2 [Bacillus rossius redtenbacheri]|uniref:uncharacterized protein LOC134530123 isoform X2 n=1 Tax=Bacillus rossius redtenbacheri TaxID=93214 RepID=UPI002FDE47BD